MCQYSERVPSEPYAVVVGGAAMDLKARSADPVRLHTSNPGTLTQTAGGVGRNIAEGLARLGSRVHLVAAIGDDLAGEDLLARTARAGVGLGHIVRVPEPTGSYLALLDSDGELIVAVADLAATDALTVAQVAGARDLIGGAAVVVLDGNLPAGVLVWVLTIAAAASVRTVLEPVSVAKAGRLSGLVQPAHPLFTLTPNLDELAALAGRPVADTRDAISAARELQARGVAHVWVSRGERGSLFCADDGTVTVLDAAPATVVDVTGAGDALTAGYVHGLLAGEPPLAAARTGHLAAALTIASPQTVRPDLGEAFARARSATRGALR